MILKGFKFCIYSGDVNLDGTIDISDGSLIDNDASNFASGYVPTDINGDGIVDLADAVFADNNGYNFVTRLVPPGAGPEPVSAKEKLPKNSNSKDKIKNSIPVKKSNIQK